MNSLVESKNRQTTGLYGIPSARDVAIELITNFPPNDMVAGFEVNDFYAS